MEDDTPSRFERIPRRREGRMPVAAWRSALAASHKTYGSRRATKRIARQFGSSRQRRRHRIAW